MLDGKAALGKAGKDFAYLVFLLLRQVEQDIIRRCFTHGVASLSAVGCFQRTGALDDNPLLCQRKRLPFNKTHEHFRVIAPHPRHHGVSDGHRAYLYGGREP